MRALVIGERILDYYFQMGFKKKKEGVPCYDLHYAYKQPGGACAVSAMLQALDIETDDYLSPNLSYKYWFLNGPSEILWRVDFDNHFSGSAEPGKFVVAPDCDVVVITDYGKGWTKTHFLEKTVERIREQNKEIPIVLDVYDDRVPENYPPVDVVFVKGLPETKEEVTEMNLRLVRRWQQRAGIVINKNRKKGLSYWPGFVVDEEAAPRLVEPFTVDPGEVFASVDRTGAGDVLVSSFVSGLLSRKKQTGRWAWENQDHFNELLLWCCAAVGANVMKIGAVPVTKEEAQAVLETILTPTSAIPGEKI